MTLAASRLPLALRPSETGRPAPKRPARAPDPRKADRAAGRHRLPRGLNESQRGWKAVCSPRAGRRRPIETPQEAAGARLGSGLTGPAGSTGSASEAVRKACKAAAGKHVGKVRAVARGTSAAAAPYKVPRKLTNAPQPHQQRQGEDRASAPHRRSVRSPSGRCKLSARGQTHRAVLGKTRGSMEKRGTSATAGAKLARDRATWHETAVEHLGAATAMCKFMCATNTAAFQRLWCPHPTLPV